MSHVWNLQKNDKFISGLLQNQLRILNIRFYKNSLQTKRGFQEYIG
jgi:hypothetical protein